MNSSSGIKLARSSLWMVAVQGFNRFLTFFFALYAARVLGVDGFGQYGFAIALTVFFVVLAECGLFLHQTRMFPILKDAAEASRLMADSIVLRFLLGLIAVILFIFIGLISGKSFDVKILIVLMAISLFINNLIAGYSSALIGFQRFGLFGIFAGGTQLIATGLAILALYLGLGLIGIGISQVICSTIVFIAIVPVVSRTVCRPARFQLSESVKTLLREAAPLGAMTLLATFYYKANFAIVSLIDGDQNAGYYNAAFALINGLTVLANTFSAVLLPQLSKTFTYEKENLGRLYKTAYRYLFFAGFGIAFGTSVIAEPLIKTLYSSRYIPAVSSFILLTWALALMFTSSLQSSLLVARQANRSLMTMTAIAAIGNVGLSLILIPQLGFIGAAIAMIASEGFCWIYGFIYNSDVLPLKSLLSYSWRMLAASAIMLIILGTLRSLNVFVLILVGIAVYISVLFVAKGFTISDILTLKKSIARPGS